MAVREIIKQPVTVYLSDVLASELTLMVIGGNHNLFIII
jgi:hypothetical protein